jgi:hypothetical protein
MPDITTGILRKSKLIEIKLMKISEFTEGDAMKTILESDIEIYTAFVEEAKRKLKKHVHTYDEPKNAFLVKKYEDVLDALLELKSALCS